MTSKIEKPYVLRVAELIYSKIIEIKKQNPEVNNIQAFEIFMTTKDYDSEFLLNIAALVGDQTPASRDFLLNG